MAYVPRRAFAAGDFRRIPSFRPTRAAQRHYMVNQKRGDHRCGRRWFHGAPLPGHDKCPARQDFVAVTPRIFLQGCRLPARIVFLGCYFIPATAILSQLPGVESVALKCIADRELRCPDQSFAGRDPVLLTDAKRGTYHTLRSHRKRRPPPYSFYEGIPHPASTTGDVHCAYHLSTPVDALPRVAGPN